MTANNNKERLETLRKNLINLFLPSRRVMCGRLLIRLKWKRSHCKKPP